MTRSVSAHYVSEQMRAALGSELDHRVSYPIASSDIRRWAVAVYYPELPPQRFWATPADSLDSGDLTAPEDFNPFAWLIAEPAGPPPSLRDPEEVLGIPGPDVQVRMRGGMSVEYGVPMRPGDIITSVRRLADYDERDGRRGPMLFTTVADTWTNQRNEVVKNFEFTFIRFAETPQPRMAAADRPAPAPAQQHQQAEDSTVAQAGDEQGQRHPDLPDVGAEIPTFTRVTGPANWNRYAAVNDEFVAIHMDDEAGRDAGAPGAFGMGNLQWAYLHTMLREWLGDRGRIARLACQLRALNTKGQTVTSRGRITGIRTVDLGTLVDLDVWTEEQGQRTLAKGTATVMLRGSENPRVSRTEAVT